MRTRIGIGKNSIDHAAGLPLSQRASRPEFIRPESTRPAYEEQSGLSASRHWGQDDAPVVLPLRKTSAVVWTAVVLVLVPIAIWLLLALASKSTPGDSQEHTGRSDVVAPQPQSAP
jgi:hypothetical protein